MECQNHISQPHCGFDFMKFRFPSGRQMNLALIHDRLCIKSFWEKRISRQSQQTESEEQRLQRSALNKLRGEWVVRLENRTKHLKNLSDVYVRKPRAEEPAEQT